MALICNIRMSKISTLRSCVSSWFWKRNDSMKALNTSFINYKGLLFSEHEERDISFCLSFTRFRSFAHHFDVHEQKEEEKGKWQDSREFFRKSPICDRKTDFFLSLKKPLFKSSHGDSVFFANQISYDIFQHMPPEIYSFENINKQNNMIMAVFSTPSISTRHAA